MGQDAKARAENIEAQPPAVVVALDVEAQELRIECAFCSLGTALALLTLAAQRLSDRILEDSLTAPPPQGAVDKTRQKA